VVAVRAAIVPDAGKPSGIKFGFANKTRRP